MRIPKQSARQVGLIELTATIGLVAGAVWLAANNTTRTAVRQLGRRLEQIDKRTEAGYIDAYLAGAIDRISQNNS